MIKKAQSFLIGLFLIWLSNVDAIRTKACRYQFLTTSTLSQKEKLRKVAKIKTTTTNRKFSEIAPKKVY
jgi:hypothetical protein